MTNKGTNECGVFKTKDMARIEIYSDKIVHADTVVNLDFSVVGSGKG